MSDPLLLEKIEALRSLIDERDKRYTERDASNQRALAAALAAAKEQVQAAFQASEKAIDKADINAEKWRANANEWRSAMMDRETKFASRLETDSEVRALRGEIASLKDTRSRGAGAIALWGYIAAGIMLIIAVLTFVSKLGG